VTCRSAFTPEGCNSQQLWSCGLDDWAKECGDVSAAGGRLDEATSGSVLVLLSGHFTMTDGAQGSQVVHVASSATLGHRQDVIHIPELPSTHTHTCTCIINIITIMEQEEEEYS